MHHPSRRRQNLVRIIKEEKLDAFLVTNPLNVTYLTGFTGDSSFLLLTAKKAILLSDTRFTIQIAEECPGLETAIRGHNKTTWQESADAIAKLGLRAVGVESQHLTVANFDLLAELAPDHRLRAEARLGRNAASNQGFFGNRGDSGGGRLWQAGIRHAQGASESARHRKGSGRRRGRLHSPCRRTRVEFRDHRRGRRPLRFAALSSVRSAHRGGRFLSARLGC